MIGDGPGRHGSTPPRSQAVASAAVDFDAPVGNMYENRVMRSFAFIDLSGFTSYTDAQGDDAAVAGEVALGMAPFNGRINIGSAKVASESLGPGAVLPQLIHGGPGRAGGGEELGGLRGLSFYMQRTALQGYKPLLEKMTGQGHRI